MFGVYALVVFLFGKDAMHYAGISCGLALFEFHGFLYCFVSSSVSCSHRGLVFFVSCHI